MRSCAFAYNIRYPSPALAPAHSPITAPIVEIDMPIFAPEKINGNADGMRTFQSICQRDARNILNRFTVSGSVDFKPSNVFSTIAKNTMIAAITTFEAIPNLNHPTNKGAIAKTGTVCEPMTYG